MSDAAAAVSLTSVAGKRGGNFVKLCYPNALVAHPSLP
jgi:hypothetical protein